MYFQGKSYKTKFKNSEEKQAAESGKFEENLCLKNFKKKIPHSLYSTAVGANKCPEICTNILCSLLGRKYVSSNTTDNMFCFYRQKVWWHMHYKLYGIINEIWHESFHICNASSDITPENLTNQLQKCHRNLWIICKSSSGKEIIRSVASEAIFRN